MLVRVRPLAIPPLLARNVTGAWGERGTRWLARLPALLDEVAREWRLAAGEPYPLSYHWVVPVSRADGSAAVLKLGVPGQHLSAQAEALGWYAGEGAVRLLAADLARGALLLERADPGGPATDLVPERDEQATAALISVARRLHRAVPVGCTLPDLRAEGAALRAHLRRFPGDDPLPRRLVERAGRLFDELCDSAPDPVILHGDLHHDNVLRAGREPWLAIDPFGLVGDPGFECGAILYNPDPPRREDDLLALVPARIDQLADGFDLPVDRVVAWCFVMGVLSEVWNAQDDLGTVGTRALDVAVMLAPRLA